MVEYRPLKDKLLLRQSFSSGGHLDWNVRKVCTCGLWGKNGWHRAGEPWISTIFFKLKPSAIVFRFCLIFSFLVVLASVAANDKAATESDLLNNIAGVLKYAHDKIGAVVVEK